MNKNRCSWVVPHHALSIAYHDNEWGNPCYDDHKLFEMLILEGAQAGLSWHRILTKREHYRIAFDNFDPQLIATYNQSKITELLHNVGIIRNKRKIQSAIQNAKVFLAMQKEYGSFAKYLWAFVDNQPIRSHFADYSLAPTSTELSQTIAKDLQKRGMSFVGPTIIYAYLQAVGVVNDHQTNCFLFSLKDVSAPSIGKF